MLLATKSLNSIAAAMNTLFAELITVISINFYNVANLSPSFLRVKPLTLKLSGAPCTPGGFSGTHPTD